MQRADLQLLVNQRKPACVLDPALVLCRAQGPLLASRLTQVMEPWLTRSFWQALDASELLLGRMDRPETDTGIALSPAALSAWIALREGTEAGAIPFRWVGDRLPESQLQDGADIDALDRYELLAEGLLRRGSRHEDQKPGWCTRFDAVGASFDALVLSALLDGALLLSPADNEPAPVLAARGAELRTTQLDPMPEHSLFSAERSFVRQALAAAGLAALLESGPRLAALHVLLSSDDDTPDASDEPADPWARAQVWWYLL
jgi:hypothetical protein